MHPSRCQNSVSAATQRQVPRFLFIFQGSDESDECLRVGVIEFGVKLRHFALDAILDDLGDALVGFRHAMQIRPFVTARVAVMAVSTVSGRSKPAKDGQMKTGHCEGGIAQPAATAAMMRDEPTQREPATFHRHAGGQRLVSTQDRPRTGPAPGNGGPLFAFG
jgi:hypothetical protein